MARLQQAGGVQHVRHMVAFQAQLLLEGRHVREGGDAIVVVAEEHENGVIEVIAFPGHVHVAAHVVVEQPHRVVLGGIAEAVGVEFLFRRRTGLEVVVVLRNGEGPVVAGGLDKGEERLVRRQGLQNPVGFLEQVQVGDAPDVHVGRLPVAFLVELQVVDAAREHRLQVGPAGVAAHHVQLPVALQLVDDVALVADQRVTAGGLLRRHVGDAGEKRPDAFRGAGDRHVEVLEEPAFAGDAVEIGGGVERCAVGAHAAGAQRFQHHHHDVRRPVHVQPVWLDRHVALEIQRLPGLLRQRQEVRHQRVVFLHRLAVEGLAAEQGGVVEEQHRIQPQGRHRVIAGGEGVTPAQRHRVFQVDVGDPAEQAEHQCQEHHHAADPLAAGAHGHRRAQQETARQRPENQRHHRGHGQPAQGDPHHRIAFPDHARGDRGIFQEAEGGHVQPVAQVDVMAEVEDIGEHHDQHRQGDVHQPQHPHRGRAHQIKARQPGQHRQGQHHQQRQPQIEAQPHAQGMVKVAGIRLHGVAHFGEEREEHRSHNHEQCEQRHHAGCQKTKPA